MEPAGSGARHRRSKAEVADRELGNSSQSIEGQAKGRTPIVYESQNYSKSFPAGIEPTPKYPNEEKFASKPFSRFFQVPAKPKAHRGEHAVLIIRLAA
jgi:hypothetical protein